MTTKQTNQKMPDEHGHFGRFGGRFVPETLMAALDELEAAYHAARADLRGDFVDAELRAG